MASRSKPWFHSRTIWLNAVVAGLAIAEAKLNILQPLLPVNFYAAVAFGLPVLNAAMRIVTTMAVSLSGDKP